jgi:CubicO group peptidase (beta-lactamase class C family)
MTLPRTQQLLAEGTSAGLHLGGQLYVSLQGRPVADLAFGENRPGQAMTTDTLMLWLSSTKPVAAVAIAQLWEAGQLRLDDPVAQHVPEFAPAGKERITIRHLLTHTGGIRTLDVGWPERGWDEIVARICRMRPEPRWVPGEKAGYHPESSWFMLGEIVRRVAGVDFSGYVRAKIFEPLALFDCWVGMPPERFTAYGTRIGAMWDTGTSPATPHDWHRAERVTSCSPGGNGYGPMRELGQLYETLLADGERQGTRLLSPQTVEALVARHRVGLLDHTFRAAMDWGLGFIPNPAVYGDRDVPYSYGRHASRRAFGHSGSRSSTAFADPEHGLVVALAVNGRPSDVAHRERFRALTETIYEDLGLAPMPDASAASPGRHA